MTPVTIRLYLIFRCVEITSYLYLISPFGIISLGRNPENENTRLKY